MAKSVMVISTSLRKGGNSLRLAQAFRQGAEEAGHKVSLVDLNGKKIGFCTGCNACDETLRCVNHDDADRIVQQMLKADVVAFATPVYYYGISGQLKTLLDRSTPIFSADYAFRDIYLLASAADSEAEAVDGSVTALMGWVVCFKKTSLKGVVRGTGVNAVGDIEGKASLRDAYEMGKAV